MDKIFKSHKELTDNDFKLLWEKGLFVFDTNVLLDLYRLPESAKNDLLSILLNKKILEVTMSQSGSLHEMVLQVLNHEAKKLMR